MNSAKIPLTKAYASHRIFHLTVFVCEMYFGGALYPHPKKLKARDAIIRT